jgi:ABC-type glycerol-3-phosphate transport system substrate-binding protein
MKLTRTQIIIIGGVIVFAVLLYFLFSLGGKPKVVQSTASITIWGTESPAAMNDLISLYGGARPGAKATYVQVAPSQYEAKLLSALAAGTGPDVFEIGDHSLARWKSVLAPMPTSTFAATFNISMLPKYFPDVVGDDFVSSGNLYALPLSIDTLAMIYNKDYFDSAGIAVPPATWEDFDADVVKLRVVSSTGQIARAAVALGGTKTSMANAEDVLYLLMLQNGARMTSVDHSSAQFAGKAGEAAVNFYLQFSNPASPYYTWSDAMGDALQNFIQGKTAVIFDYQSALAEIKQKSPFLNIGVAAMPQPSGASVAINYPNYLGLAVAKNGDVTDSWDFILLNTVFGNGGAYLKDANVPAAERTAIAAQEAGSDPVIAMFAKQALSAQSWHESNDVQIDAAFDSMLHNVLNNSRDVSAALRDLQDTVNNIMSGR